MARPRLVNSNTGSKGRITLGGSYANRIMLVETHGNEIILRLARVSPKGGAWLHENQKAMVSVRRGLQQAKARKFVKKGLDLAAAAEGTRQLSG